MDAPTFARPAGGGRSPIYASYLDRLVQIGGDVLVESRRGGCSIEQAAVMAVGFLQRGLAVAPGVVK